MYCFGRRRRRRRRRWRRSRGGRIGVKEVSKGTLIDIITRWIVLTNKQHTSVVAPHSGASQPEALVPNDLRVVAAHGVWVASVGVPVKVLILQRP